MSDELSKAVDEVLIDSMAPGLKAAIDRLLARGVNREGIMAFCKASADREAVRLGDPNRGKLTVAAIEAYLDSKKTT